MPTTSILILIVVAVWAAFLLQYWIRRRDVVATARSVDRFSEAMRVLSTREPLPRGIAPKAHRVQQSARPEVSVKAPRTSLRAGENLVGGEMNVRPDKKKSSAPGWRERINSVAESGAMKKLTSINSRQVRGIALLGALAFTLVTLGLAAFSITSWWLPLAGLLLTAGVVAWLRSMVIMEGKKRQQRPARRGAPRPAVRRTEQATQGAQPKRRPQAHPAAPVVAADESEEAAAVEAQESPSPFGFEAPAEPVAHETTVEAEQDVVEEPAFDGDAEDVRPGTWAPASVPPPTYTLKERAPQTPVEPAATTSTDIDDLPFDGMAFDEELEDLPPVYRAG